MIIDKPLVNRRFVRIKALQNLYAFHINRQANYHHALEMIKREFVADIFAATPISTAQLEEEQSQTSALFEAWVLKKKPDLFIPSEHGSSTVKEAAQKIWTYYHSKLIQDINALQSGWNAALENIQEAYLMILQLFIEWFEMAQAQSKQKTERGFIYPIALENNEFLTRLLTNEHFVNLIQPYKINWEQHIELITRWYQQFIKEDAILVKGTDGSVDSKKEKSLIKYLIENVVFAQEDIQSFFYELDLSWEEHQSIVKKLSQETFSQESSPWMPKDLKETLLSQGNPGGFYSSLVNNTLEQEDAIDTLIQQHIKHWSIDRTILIDRIIIRMGICEIKFFDDVPNKVVINEYVDLAKRYSTIKSSQFINGVLDTIAKST